ncbi:MAG: beta-propeller domain-containing protein, partial [Oscillospiraceae bacterium]
PAPELLSLQSYDDVYDVIASAVNTSYGEVRGVFATDTMAVSDGAAVSASAPAVSTATESAAIDSGKAMETNADGSSDYSGTNVQVDGIDESDIVKTDGEYIYILRNSRELTILKALGDGTSVVSDTIVSKESEYDENYSYNEYVSDMYLSGESIILIRTVYEWSMPETGDYYNCDNCEKVYADIYDVSDPENPRISATFGQDGTLSSSRLMDGVLYLISTRYVYQTVEDDPGTFIPYTYAKGVATIMPIDRIIIPGHISSTSWTVISSIDIGAGESLSNISVLGNSSTVYMSEKNLYIGSSVWDTQESDPYTEDQYSVIDCRSYSATDVMRFSVTDGIVAYAASAQVPGYLVNQFAMDEYDGNLRVVTTTSENRYHAYTDEKYGWTNYVYDEYPNTSGLYVLDSDMALIGSVTGLGEDERVYSVRFSDDIGYFVTFRQTDPLFAVDLSDPENPTVLSALKIPGFSEYLHPYGDGLLLGIGMSADEDGRTQNLKLSMFDVSDPADVTEKTSMELEATWSPALYNHHAVLADMGKNLIGFATDSAYELYAYTDGSFKLLASIATAGWASDTRGVYIGDNIYICTPESVTILSLDGFAKLKTVTLPNG